MLTEQLVIDARSSLDALSSVVRAGVKVLIWTGDADYVCNWVGTMRVAEAVDWPGRTAFLGREMKAYTVNGEEKANFKTEENLTYMTVRDAGHQMTWYRKYTNASSTSRVRKEANDADFVYADPEFSLQVFRQFMSTGELIST